MYAVEVKNLVKFYGNFPAVKGISFKIKKGELFGFLGPNGAGKTTTINILATILSKTDGEAYVNGFDVSTQKDDVRKSIGIVFQEPALDNQLTGRENLEFHAMLYGLSKKEREKRIKEVLKLVELENKADILVSNYSGGMRRRLEIARGLIHKPKVLFLDEPTLGLDAQTRRKIWGYIKKLNEEEKMTILLTTHYMEEADFLCDRIAIIDEGKLVVVDTSKKLKESLGGDVITLEFKNGLERFLRNIKTIKNIKDTKREKNKLFLTVIKGESILPKIFKLADKLKCEISNVNIRQPSLEDVFLHYTGKQIREEKGDFRRMMLKRKMRMMSK